MNNELFKKVQKIIPGAKFVRTLSGGLSNDAIIFEIDESKLVAKYEKNDGSLDLAVNSKYEVQKIASSIISSVEGVHTPQIIIKNGIEYQEFIEGYTLDDNSIKLNLDKVANTISALHTSTINFEKRINDNKKFSSYLLSKKYFTQLRRYQMNSSEDSKAILDLAVNSTTQAIHYLSEIEILFETIFKDTKVFSHNDALAANFIMSDNLNIIDFEYSAYNFPIFDLVSIVLECNLDEDQEAYLINTYIQKSKEGKHNTLDYSIFLNNLQDDSFRDVVIEAMKYSQNVLWYLWAVLKSHNTDGELINSELTIWGYEKFTKTNSVNVEDLLEKLKKLL